MQCGLDDGETEDAIRAANLCELVKNQPTNDKHSASATMEIVATMEFGTVKRRSIKQAEQKVNALLAARALAGH